MIRIVLAGTPDGTWKLFRQPQWMAHVRDAPGAASWLRHHFDIAEDAYAAALAEWDASGARTDHAEALACLGRHGAAEVHRR